jgi:hypothetical protein
MSPAYALDDHLPTVGYPRYVATVYDLSLEQLTERVVELGEPAFRAKQLYRQLWHRNAVYDEMPDVPKRLPGTSRSGAADRGRAPRRAHRRPRRDAEGAPQARR